MIVLTRIQRFAEIKFLQKVHFEILLTLFQILISLFEY